MVMKKFSALFVVFAYLSLFNYCVTYAVVKGEAHHPSPSPLNASAPSHDEGDHHDHHDHDAQEGHADSHEHGSSHEHNSSGESEETCCVNLTEGVHVLLPAGITAAEPVSLATPLVLMDLDLSTLSPSFFSSHEDRGPPGSVAQDGFFSSRSSRAPPTTLPSL